MPQLTHARLLLLASVRDYALVADDARFAAVFGSIAIRLAQFDHWFIVCPLQVQQDPDLLERWLRGCRDRVEPTGVPVVDRWLSEMRVPDA